MSLTPASAGAGEELFTEVVVVRHGETASNASRIVQGQMDTELNEAGRQQAVVVARHLSREAKPAAVYSSDLKRAAETAKIIARDCGVSNVVLSEELRERHMGYLQGLTWEEAMAISPDSLGGFDIFMITEGSNPDSRNQELPGGGESMNQLNERCVSYLNKIAQQHIAGLSAPAYSIFLSQQTSTSRQTSTSHEPANTTIILTLTGERVVVVSHGAAILGLCRHTDPPGSFVRRRIPNTSLNVFRISGVTGQWTLKTFGDVSHLRGNEFLESSFGGDDGASA